MNINHFKMFVQIVEQGSISKVSEQMNISQSALSQQVRTMEQEFNASLLERTSKGVFPTPIGILVYNKSQEMLGTYDEMLSSISYLQNQDKALRILATPTAYSYALPCTFYHVKNKYPHYSLDMEVMSSTLIEEKILKGYGDMGVIVGKPKNKNLVSKKFFSDRIYLVAGKDFITPPTINCQELYNYPLLMLTNTQKSRQLLDKQLKNLGITINKLHIPYTLESTESIKLSAINSYGLAFLPYMSIKKELYLKQLRIIDFEGSELETHFYSIKRPTYSHLNPQVTQIITYIEKITKDTIC